MKNILLILHLCLLSQSGFCKSDTIKIYKTVFIKNELKQNRYLNELKIIKNRSEIEYTFSPNGDTLSSIISYKDSNGNDSLFFFIEQDDTIIDKFQFKSKNLLSQEFSYNNNRNSWDTIIYQYIDTFLCKKIYKYSFGEIYDTFIYQRGNLLKKISFSTSGDTSVQKFYYYNNIGKLIEEKEFQDHSKNEWYYKYYKNGKIKTIEIYNWLGSKSPLYSYFIIKYKYHKNGQHRKRISKEIKFSNGIINDNKENMREITKEIISLNYNKSNKIIKKSVKYLGTKETEIFEYQYN